MFNFFKKKKKANERGQEISTQERFRQKYTAFQQLLHENNHALEIMADIEEKMTGEYLFDINYITGRASAISESMSRLVNHLDNLSHGKYAQLHRSYESIKDRIDAALQNRIEIPQADDILPLQQIQADMTLIAGGKMANLGVIRHSLNIRVPEGFVITSSAFKRFMEHSQVQEKLSKMLSGLNIKNMVEIEEASRAIQEMIIEAELPPELERHILEATDDLYSRSRQKQGFSVRSSAIFEDGDFSFAGQYETLLHVKPDRIIRSYKTVVASLFSPRAIFYAKNKGFSEGDMVMAVGVMEMVSARAGGVLYTRDPNDPGRNVMIINGAWGLAKAVVDGKMKTDTFVIERNSGALLETNIGEKSHMYAAGIDGGLHVAEVEEQLHNAPCLTKTEINGLGRYALDLETHYGKPQDIEWAVSETGEVFILQTRPLRLMKQETATKIPRRIDGYAVLIDKGVIASRGIGVGPVYFVRSDDDLQGFPEGAVLVSRTTSTRFVTVMERAAAIITDIGGATGHMASLAREYQVPAILNTDSATRILQQGQEITVDAFHCNIYEGRVPELLDYAAKKKKSFQ
ncbi:MAG: PEP/pyruvate-binding domain-containing protein, partial [Nitrospirota bacterium]|nr:PEP/pyruvate-binding domain-containing protein [Nitrospirota bacterium]